MPNLIRIVVLLILSQPLIVVAGESSLGNGSVDAMAFVKMFMGLLFTVAVIFLLAWLSRKTKLINSLNAGYQIKTLATQSLTHREKLCPGIEAHAADSVTSRRTHWVRDSRSRMVTLSRPPP